MPVLFSCIRCFCLSVDMFQHYSKGRTSKPHASALNSTRVYAGKCSISRYKCLPGGGKIRIVHFSKILDGMKIINPLKPELNPICYLLAVLAHHFLHVSRIRVKSLTIRLLMSYVYGAPILDVSRSHTTTQHSR